ncbi:MAG: hypothetical protein M3Y23_03920 [Actinomycetota bacterium]|nr:hypothetical protein [Actinomycetota bacterium]
MTTEETTRNRDGSSLQPNEYAALVLAVIVPLIGLGFGIWLKSEGRAIGTRVIVLSIVAAAGWVALAVLL